MTQQSSAVPARSFRDQHGKSPARGNRPRHKRFPAGSCRGDGRERRSSVQWTLGSRGRCNGAGYGAFPWSRYLVVCHGGVTRWDNGRRWDITQTLRGHSGTAVARDGSLGPKLLSGSPPKRQVQLSQRPAERRSGDPRCWVPLQSSVITRPRLGVAARGGLSAVSPASGATAWL